MKKLFISCPMKGRTDEAIKDSMERMHKIAELVFGEELEPINSFIPANDPEDNNRAIWYLGEAIKLMSEADYFIGITEYGFHGCEIERHTANEFGIPSVFISMHYLMPDIQDDSHPIPGLAFGFGGRA